MIYLIYHKDYISKLK